MVRVGDWRFEDCCCLSVICSVTLMRYSCPVSEELTLNFLDRSEEYMSLFFLFLNHKYLPSQIFTNFARQRQGIRKRTVPLRAVSEALSAVNLISFSGLISIRESEASQGAAEISGSVQDCSPLFSPFDSPSVSLRAAQDRVGDESAGTPSHGHFTALP